jgi:hypothetical protein
VYRDGDLLGSTTGLSYVDSSLASYAGYHYVVRGYDAAGQTGDASAAVAMSTSAVTTNAAPHRTCQLVRVGRRAFRVRVVRGFVSCNVARRTMRAFIGKHRSPKRWRCARPHGPASWTAACAQGRRKHPRVIVRAFRAR